LAVVYSKNELGIAGREPPEAASTLGKGQQLSWPFKYGGYKVLTYSNERWFLICNRWEPNLPTVVLRDDESIRVELLQGR
jgi:hypothetical protein